MEQELKDSGKFKDFYQFTFNFAKNPGQKGLGNGSDVTQIEEWNCYLFKCPRKVQLFAVCFLMLDLEMAVAYWNLVLTGRFKFLDLWNKFLLVSLLNKQKDI